MFKKSLLDSNISKPNHSTISLRIGISRNLLPEWLTYMEKAGLIMQLRDDTGGIRGLGKVDKIYLDNPTLMYLLGGDNVIDAFVVKDDIAVGYQNVLPLLAYYIDTHQTTHRLYTKNHRAPSNMEFGDFLYNVNIND